MVIVGASASISKCDSRYDACNVVESKLICITMLQCAQSQLCWLNLPHSLALQPPVKSIDSVNNSNNGEQNRSSDKITHYQNILCITTHRLILYEVRTEFSLPSGLRFAPFVRFVLVRKNKQYRLSITSYLLLQARG